MKQLSKGLFVLFSILLSVVINTAQNEYAATLEVLSNGVQVQRVNTINPISIEIASVVGVGDIIRTDETGEARITFFADGTDVKILPNSEYRILTFEELGEDDFSLTVEILIGQTVQRMNRALGANSNYDVQTPGMTLAARGTEFEIRVENSGRSAMLVSEGAVTAGSVDDETAEVPASFGIRAPRNGELSDVILADSFAELDAGLDGCAASVTTVDDVSINVRSGPSTDLPQIGIISDTEINLFMGVSEAGNWYRIPFADGFGWVLSSSAAVTGQCAGLRVFEDSWVEGETADANEVTPESEG